MAQRIRMHTHSFPEKGIPTGEGPSPSEISTIKSDLQARMYVQLKPISRDLKVKFCYTIHRYPRQEGGRYFYQETTYNFKSSFCGSLSLSQANVFQNC